MSLEVERSSACQASFYFEVEKRKQEQQWESGKPAFGFPLFHCRRGCGNVGIAQFAISKDGGRGGKPGVGFPRRPRPVISTVDFHAVLFCWKLANSFRFASCMRCAAWVSLHASAMACN